MKKITIIAYSAFLLIMVVNILFYRSLYWNQLEYSMKMLDRQVRIVGTEIDKTSMYLIRLIFQMTSLFFLPIKMSMSGQGRK
jgi:hypothetical protein